MTKDFMSKEDMLGNGFKPMEPVTYISFTNGETATYKRNWTMSYTNETENNAISVCIGDKEDVLTGNSDLLNWVSLAMSTASKQWEFEGSYALARKSKVGADIVYNNLKESGYYDK